MGGAGAAGERGDAALLLPYVPARQLRWLAEQPEHRFQEVEGTLVFADVSGFTPLTERLATRGKVGAEELTDILNDVFGRLLGVASGFGGDLLKFGGDALLLLFDGDGHEVRSAAAAAGMQAALRPFARFRTDGGTVSLRMSVGVESGTFHFHLVGDSHRELVITGPGSSRTAELEAAADAREVLLGERTAAALPARHLGRAKGPGTLLRGAPAAPRVEAPPVPAGVAPLGVPAQLRPHLLDRRDEGEHRIAVISFLQFKGTDDLLAGGGPEAVTDELDLLVRDAQEACERFGVSFLTSDVDRNGGKLLFAAGVPASAADDADRMLHAMRAVLERPRALQVRAGVNRGRCFAVDMGSPDRRTYTVMGDATNLAARVMGKAEPGTALATVAVTGALRDRFQLTGVEPFLVKGKSAAVRAAVVGPARGRATTGAVLPFAGRDEELRSLLEVLDVAGGIPVVVTGEPGMGKSRLVAEAVAALPERPVVRVEGAAYRSNQPYVAVSVPLRRLLGLSPSAGASEVAAALEPALRAADPALAELAPLVATAFGTSLPDTPATAALDPAFLRPRRHAAVTALVRTLLPRAGLLVVEDAQWIDPASADLLAAFLEEGALAEWAVCLTRRPGAGGFEVDPSSAVTIELGPLGAGERRAVLLAATAEQPLPNHVLDELARRSDGNPLFLQELLGSVAGGEDADDLPDSVEALLAGRIDALAPDDRALLREAAVLGVLFDRRHLLDLVGDDHAATLDRLRGFLVVEGDQLRFRQALVREAAYESLPFRQRRDLHGRAGELLEARAAAGQDPPADLLALHFHRAQRFEKAWRYAADAGRRARKAAAPVEASALFRMALDALRHVAGVDPDEIRRLNEELGAVSELAGDYAGASSALRSARRHARRGSLDDVRLHRSAGWLHERAGRYAEALRWYSRGLSALDQLTVRAADAEVLAVRADLLMSYGAARLRQGRLAQAVPLLEEAAALAERAGERSTLAHAYYLLDWALTDLGSAEADRYRELALPIYAELGDWAGQANVLNNLGVNAYFEGRWGDALDCYRRSREARARAGDIVQFETSANNIGEILSDQGHLDDAERLFQEALRAWQAAGFKVGIGLAHSNLGRAASRAGRFAQAADHLVLAVEQLREIGSEALALEAEARDVERLVHAGRGSEALAALADVSRRAAKLGEQPVLEAMLQRLSGWAWTQAGRLDAAREQLDASLEVATRASADFERALTLDALAKVGAAAGWDDAEACAVAAAHLFDRLGVETVTAIPLAEPVIDLDLTRV